MSKAISAAFETRREAEMVVEHLVQEHGLQPDAVEIVPASSKNSAGTEVSGSDKAGANQSGSPELGGRLVVTAHVDAAHEKAVVSSFEAHGGTPV